MNKNFLEAFNWKKPIIGMLHLKGNTDEEVFEIAKQEIDTYYNNGADAVLVENYFGTYHHMIPVLEYLQENYKDHIYGVNCLYQNTLTFELAIKYEAHFVQIDAISQDETGQETSMKKIQEFRDIIGDFPLIVGAGLTAENCTKQFAVADGGIVGSWVKDTHIATGTVDEKNVQKLIAVRDALLKGE